LRRRKGIHGSESPPMRSRALFIAQFPRNHVPGVAQKLSSFPMRIKTLFYNITTDQWVKRGYQVGPKFAIVFSNSKVTLAPPNSSAHIHVRLHTPTLAHRVRGYEVLVAGCCNDSVSSLPAGGEGSPSSLAHWRRPPSVSRRERGGVRGGWSIFTHTKNLLAGEWFVVPLLYIVSIRS